MTAKAFIPKTIWLVSPYEIPPSSGYRSARWENLARSLVARGHQVVVIISDYCHYTKRHRLRKPALEQLESGWWLVSLRGFAYHSNVGPGRLLSECWFSLQLFLLSNRWPGPPLVIVCKEPPALAGLVCKRLCRRFGARFVCDIVDLWPELFEGVLPRWLSVSGHPVFWLIRALRHANLSTASGVVSLANSHFGLVPKHIPRLTVYNGIPSSDSPTHGIFPSKHVSARIGWVTVAYIGTIGHNYDIATMLSLAERLARESVPIRLVIAGSGPLCGPVVDAQARFPDHVIFLGRVPFVDLEPILSICDVGLMPYRRGSTVEMPDKFYDYIASGLPMLTSIRGEVGQILLEEGCGAVYEAESSESLYSTLVGLVQSGSLPKMRNSAMGLTSRFSAENQFGKYADFIESLLES